MIPMLAGPLIDLGGKLIDALFETEEEKAAARATLVRMRQDGRLAELETRLRTLVRNGEDHVLLIDVGPADKIDPAVESIGRNFSKVERQATVI